ncbi:hypothetical protein [Saccharopolyspora phatthalungensis]|uniref:DUF3558 domain-containing protein n=1 Tax=Saccharopolyspora phatthalungensis TaxID=664693 RepID=A0A840Q9J1_9PSEU|nr:hypothetical protein [Saccharopolyspora phatthalungensis]MBB5155328.1 hypothetical protein [Saccharopolyspora phatthalungensis]
MPRPVTLIAVLLAVFTAVSGCASAGAKSVSSRRTVEVPKFETNKPGLLDPAFAPDRLRGVDVCATLQAVDLSKYGTPAPQFTPNGLGTCANYMKDRYGKDFDVTLYFDAETGQPSTHRIGGLPAEITDNGSDTCFTRAAYTGAETRLLAAPRGLEIQLRSDQADVCSPAVQILADVVEIIRTKPPVSPRVSGGLAGFDPCGILDQAAVRDASMGATPDSTGGEGLYKCEWFAGNGVSVELSFEVGDPQSTALPPLDLGGVRAVVVPTNDPPTCEIEWEHRKKANAAGESEYVHVEVMNMNNIPMDTCANATNLARQVRAKLPTA